MFIHAPAAAFPGSDLCAVKRRGPPCGNGQPNESRLVSRTFPIMPDQSHVTSKVKSSRDGLLRPVRADRPHTQTEQSLNQSNLYSFQAASFMEVKMRAPGGPEPTMTSALHFFW